MDKTLKQLCGLLQSEDNTRRCAGAIAIATLAPRNAQVVQMLGEALAGAGMPLASYILEALEATGSPAAVPFVMPLLDADDNALKMRAAGIIAKAGDSVVPELKEKLGKASKAQKIILTDILARIRTRESFRTILDLLFVPDFDLIREACDAVRRHMVSASPGERAAMHKLLSEFMKSDRVTAQERVMTSCLLLLGYVGCPDARSTLLKYSTPKTSPYLRRHALIGLKHLRLPNAAVQGILKAVYPYLDDPDDAIVRQVLDIMARMPQSPALAACTRKMLRSSQPAVAAFAARQLTLQDNAAGNRELLALLGHESQELREIAASGLAAHKESATRLLLDTLAKEADADRAWLLAKILKPHSERVDRKTLKKFSAIAARDLQGSAPRHEAMLYFLRNVDPKVAEAVIREAGMLHKKAKRWERAVECFRRLISTEGFDDEARYALSVCNLKLSTKDLAPNMRSEDHSLRGFGALLHNRSFGLFDRFRQDKSLDAQDLYYVGFHFAEAMGEEKEFGARLLEYVAKKWPSKGRKSRRRG